MTPSGQDLDPTVGARFAGTLTTLEAQDAILDLLMERLSPDVCALLWAEEGDFRCKACRGLGGREEQLLLERSFPRDNHCLQELLKNKTTLLLNDARSCPELQELAPLGTLSSFYAFPIAIGKLVKGILLAGHSSPHVLCEEEARAGRSIVHYGSLALRRGNRYDRIETDRDHLQELRQKLVEVQSDMFREKQELEILNQKLESSRSELSQIYNHSPSAMRVIDKEFNVLTCNDGMRALCGQDASSADARKCFEQMHGTLCGTEHCTLRQILCGKLTVDAEVEKDRKDGTLVPCRVMASPFTNARGEIIGVIEVITDLTETKRLMKRERELVIQAASEQARVQTLEETRGELEQHIAERTAELQAARDHLIQSEKLSAMGQLAAGIAHELNNPMGVILGFAQALIKHRGDDSFLSTPLRSIEREALRCKTLIQNLLVFSRVGRPEQREPLDINVCVEGALSLVTAQSSIKEMLLVKECAAGLPKLLLNNTQIQQVVINLCNNALDAMHRGGTLAVKTRLEKKHSSDYVVLEVSDTGSGIPEELRKKIFDPFFTTKPVGKGTGLGLSMVYELVKKHSGELELASTLGKGTTFTIRFPVQSSTVPGKAS
ncbi:MAG: ATP-binding protein [Elusimicrobiota bacterium]|jgi:PAS domain S-box-containing protein